MIHRASPRSPFEPDRLGSFEGISWGSLWATQ
ncbi:hypothetical protein FOMCTCXJ_CDS_0007 [Pseudomonas phage Athelas]|nr:hypothetical protein FOMCTCXJ_CDS_0007 [Pseudomonas phage Athelas]